MRAAFGRPSHLRDGSFLTFVDIGFRIAAELARSGRVTTERGEA